MCVWSQADLGHSLGPATYNPGDWESRLPSLSLSFLLYYNDECTWVFCRLGENKLGDIGTGSSESSVNTSCSKMGLNWLLRTALISKTFEASIEGSLRRIVVT